MLGESSAVLVSLVGGPDLTMNEVNRIMEQINRHCESAHLIMGAAIDEPSWDAFESLWLRHAERTGK